MTPQIKSHPARFGALLLIFSLMVSAPILSGCGGSSNSTSQSGNELGLISSGKLHVGANIPYPPFEFGQPPDYTGFDVDLINAIATNLGLEVEMENSSFQTLITDEQAGKHDLVISAVNILPEREKVVTFSDPYFNVQQALIVQKGSQIRTTKDLTSSTSVGVEQSGANQEYAENETPATVQAYANGATAFNALQAGQVDSVIFDYPAAETVVGEKYPDLEVAQVLPTPFQYGIAMQKSNTKLIDAINRELAAVIKDGTYEKIYKKWFSTTPPQAYRSSK